MDADIMAGYTTETRLSHPSQEQVEALISFLEGRLDLAKGLAKTQANREQWRKDWFRISLKLNNMPGGSVKTVKRWMKYWSDKKSSVKKKNATIELCQHEGKNDEVTPELSETEERILALMKACTNATTSELFKRRIKREPLDQHPVERSQNNIESTYLLEQTDDELQSDAGNNDSEDAYLSTYCLNGSTDTTQSKQEKHTPTVSSTRWGNMKMPPKSIPPSGQTNFMLVADQLCHIEQQRLELDRRMLDVMERNSERDHLLVEAVKAVGEGLKALAEAITKN